MRTGLLFLMLMLFLSGCVSTPRHDNIMNLRQQVMEAEQAFASTMATRDHVAFMSFLADEAVFFSGEKPLRGKQQVAALWGKYFKAGEAPFSWEPEHVEVLDSGTLALSTGPVYDSSGKRIATFTSIWRQEGAGTWRVVFDRGNPVCASP